MGETRCEVQYGRHRTTHAPALRSPARGWGLLIGAARERELCGRRRATRPPLSRAARATMACRSVECVRSVSSCSSPAAASAPRTGPATAAALDTARRAGGVVGAQVRTHQPVPGLMAEHGQDTGAEWPPTIAPMLATVRPLPTSGAGYGWEFKWDLSAWFGAVGRGWLW